MAAGSAADLLPDSARHCSRACAPEHTSSCVCLMRPVQVTLGNVFAGAVLTAGSYSLAFGRLGAAFNGEAAK